MEQDYYGTKRITAWPEKKDGILGYGVRYHPDGYRSWSPKDVFEAAYQPTNAMSFGHALAAMKDGYCVKITIGKILDVVLKYDSLIDEIVSVDFGGKWLPSQQEILSNDWCIVSPTNNTTQDV